MIFFLKKTITLSIMFAVVLMSTNSVQAQDLISNSRTGEYLRATETENRIYKEVAQVQARSAFEKIQLLELHKDQESLLNKKSSFVKDALFFTKDENAIQNLLENQLTQFTMVIPASASNNIELVLIKQDVYSEGFVVATPQGELTYDESRSAHYKGYIKGNPNSIVAISILENDIAGLIADQRGNYNLGSLSDDKSTVTLYNDRKSKKDLSTGCGNSCIHDKIDEQVKPPSEYDPQKSVTSNCVEISLTADHGIYQWNSNSIPASVDFVTTIFNQAKTLFENDGINITLSEVIVYDVVDPFASIDNASDVISEFGFSLEDNFNGDIAHLLYTEYYSWGGLAHVGTLCQDFHTYTHDWDGDGIPETKAYGPYGIGQVLDDVETFPTYSWTIKTFTHEIGHQLGSRHTQDCMWGPGQDQALDNCYETFDPWGPQPNPEGNDCPTGPAPTNGGTLMSYCDAGNYCPLIQSQCNNGTIDEFGEYVVGESSFALYGINLANGLGDFPGMINTPKSAILQHISDCGTICEEEQSCFDPSILYDLDCEEDYAPVCGCDNQTYYNICSAFYLNGITEYYLGPCTGEAQAGTTCPIINQASFEGGWGIWNDGGANCFRQNAASVANSGTKSIWMRRYGRINSDVLDLSDYEQVTIDFSLYARNMDTQWDRMFVRYSLNGGASFTTIEVLNYTIDFQNNTHTSFSLTVDAAFTDQTVFRFMSATNSNTDIFNVDDIVISGCSNPGAGSNGGVIDYLSDQTNAPCYDASNVYLDIDCFANPQNLVCGCDGQTYYNNCFAFYSGLTTYTGGPCNGGMGTGANLQSMASPVNELEASGITVQYELNESTVWFKRTIPGEGEILNYQIFDFNGRMILAATTTQDRWSADTQDLPKGMYILNTILGAEKFIIR